MKHRLFFPATLTLLLFAAATRGQSDKALLRELAEENQKSVEALALYPSDVRLAIFEAARYPEVLVKMNDTRRKTADAFRALIEDFPRSTQETFYDLTRYPGLLDRLAEQRESPAALRETLQQLPEDRRDEALGTVQDQMPTLLKIRDLDRTARSAFGQMIAGYPEPAQAAFRRIVDLPEVLEILNEDLRFTVLIGDVYREDPAWVIRKTDSLNLAVARSQAQELDEWKKSVESDPQAEQEFKAASQEYAAEYGYDDQDYPGDDLYYNDEANRQVVVTDYAYPWWFGYPWWYPAPCWRPYPWWYNWGYYPGQGHIVIIYLPSRHFMDWYFYHPHHHYHYSHLSSHFVNHYYGHRRSGTTISMGVGAWRDRNRTVISDEWMRDRGRLPERLKEFGRFEEGRQAYNARNPRNPATQEEYLNKTPRKYPELERSRTQAAEEIKRGDDVPRTRPSEWAPRKEPAPVTPQTRPDRQPEPRPTQKPRTEKPRVQPPADTKERPPRPSAEPPRTQPKPERPVEDAKDYHRQKWDETKRTETRRERPAARPVPKQTPAPKRTEPKKESGRKN